MEEPQPPPAPSSPATFAQPHRPHPHPHSLLYRTPESSPSEHEFAYNEKDAHHRPQPLRVERGSKGSTRSHGRAHDSVISHPFSPKASSPPSPSSSISSAGPKHRSISEIQQHPASAHNQLSFPPRAHLDPEKASHVSPHSAPSPTRVSASNPDVTAVVYDSGEYHEKGPEEKPWQLLFFLSGPCALLSLLITIWTVFSVFIALLLQPLRIVSSGPSLSSQLITFLAPPLNLQLHLIYSCNSATNYSAPMLVVIHLFSPIVAFGVAIGAWTSAFFWFFSAILGDPAGQDGRNDGQESMLGVRNWWERWLSRALR